MGKFFQEYIMVVVILIFVKDGLDVFYDIMQNKESK